MSRRARARELERWEKLYRSTLAGVISAQRRAPNPRMVAQLSRVLTDAAYDCIRETARARFDLVAVLAALVL